MCIVVFDVVVIFLSVSGCSLRVCVVSKCVGGFATFVVALIVDGVGLLPCRVGAWMVRVASLAVRATARAGYAGTWMVGVASMAVGATAEAGFAGAWMIEVASMAV